MGEPAALGEPFGDLARLCAEGAKAAREAQRDWKRCETHGEHFDPRKGCDACRARAWRVTEMLRELPARYAEAIDRPRLPDPQAFDLTMRWSGIDRVGLKSRETGAGKTFAAVALARRLITADERVRSFAFVDVIELVRAKRNAEYGRETALEKRAVDSDLVILDDVGQEPEEYARVVAAVIFARYTKKRATIFTTWLEPAQAADEKRYGGGVARRLFEGATIIRFGGKK